MAATTTLLGLVTPTQGTLTGTWGDTVNYGISDYLDIAIAGTLSFAGDGAITLANTTGSSSGNSIGATTAQYAIIRVTGTLTTAKIITGPSYSKTYLVVNAATGSTVTFKASGQTGVSIAVGETALVYYNGTDYVKVVGTATAGAAGGSTTQVQYNNAGVLAGITGATTNGTALTLVAPVLGTPASATLTLATGLPISTGVSGLGTGIATALAVNVGTAGAPVVNGGALGTPSSGSLANCTAYPGTSALTTVGALNSGSITSGFGSIDVGADEISGGAIKATTNVSADYPSSSAMAFTSGNGKLFAWGSTVGTAAEINIRGMSSDGSVFHQAAFTQTGLNSTAIGQTSPAAGAFTTLSATGTLSGGTSGTAYSFSGSAPATSLTLDASGNLGIGTSSPTAKLTVNSFVNISGPIASFKQSVETSAFNGLALQRSANDTTLGLSFNSSADAWQLSSSYSSTGAYKPIQLVTSDVVRVTLDSAGNLGLGVTPSAWSTSNGKAIEVGAAGNGLYGYGASNFNMSSGAYYNGSNWIYTVSSTPVTYYNQSSGLHQWYNAASGTAGNTITFTQAMTLDASGNLLVGTTSGSNRLTVSSTVNDYISRMYNTNATGADMFYLQSTADPNDTISKTIYTLSNASARFYVHSNGGIGNYQANNVNLSDRREKTNFAPAKSYLDTICAIPVQTFNYIDQNMEKDGGLTLGVVAQDVQAVAPELVMESNWGTEEDPKMRLSIYQTDLQYALMKCIQEQQALITQLTARITALETA